MADLSPAASFRKNRHRDLPSALLIAVVLGIGQAMDSWLMTQQPDQDDLPRLTAASVDADWWKGHIIRDSILSGLKRRRGLR